MIPQQLLLVHSMLLNGLLHVGIKRDNSLWCDTDIALYQCHLILLLKTILPVVRVSCGRALVRLNEPRNFPRKSRHKTNTSGWVIDSL